MSELKKEDYQEPCCPFDTSRWTKKPVLEQPDIRRITAKLDEFFYEKDFTGAKRLLLYWLKTAKETENRSLEFQMENELMGLCRKLDLGEEAATHAERALTLAEALGIDGDAGGATAFVNAGTVFKAFGQAERSLPLFEKARTVYEKQLNGNDGRLGGLYNNYALALEDLKRYDEALVFYRKALNVMANVPGGEADAAITWLNVAGCEEARDGLEAALPVMEEAMDNAWELLNSDALPKNGCYRFVCEKCIPAFEHYGYIARAEELGRRCGHSPNGGNGKEDPEWQN